MNITCPVCNSVESSRYFLVRSGDHTYSVETCLACGHVYTRFDFEVDPDQLYNDEVYKVIDNRDSVYSKIMDHEYGNVLQYIKRQYPQHASLLDFGSGKGVFLNLAQKAGLDSLGIETAEERADFAEKKYGLKIIRTMYSNGPVAKQRFDVITLFHVLEHLPQPKELLQNLLRDNLKANGMLILEVPNLSSWQSAIAGNKWMHLDIPRHLSHFSKERLVEFCGELDLKIVRSDYFSWHLGVLGMCHSILSIFGYKGKIIRDLKNYNKKLMLALLLVLPLSLVLELFASALNRGGVIRLYCRRAQ